MEGAKGWRGVGAGASGRTKGAAAGASEKRTFWAAAFDRRKTEVGACGTR